MSSKERIRYSFFAALGLLAACTGSPEEKPPVMQKPATTRPAALPAEPTLCLLPTYDVEQVSEARKSFDKTRLSNKLVRQMVERNPRLPRLFNEYFDAWELYALDTVRCQAFSLVSYLYRHEDCCTDIYYVTFGPDGKKVIDWAAIAATGADGMWSATATMQAQANTLRVTKRKKDSEDGEQPSFQDSVVTDYSVTPQGKFIRARVDSVRTKLTTRN
ncbi:hypothetical protein [Hymenobacter persicinus]|uniref:Lipoprotein n=1 Tax=Hymenobacter persicinus TaxID=2025506 RepID=A0A4Q5LDP9_9BACT|nr:hypothetical protein [Hymenobacter persicinus]RYU79904.1 hypothetical protein EWM57_09470 [Hymenobacter persicinus]